MHISCCCSCCALYKPSRTIPCLTPIKPNNPRVCYGPANFASFYYFISFIIQIILHSLNLHKIKT